MTLFCLSGLTWKVHCADIDCVVGLLLVLYCCLCARKDTQQHLLNQLNHLLEAGFKIATFHDFLSSSTGPVRAEALNSR